MRDECLISHKNNYYLLQTFHILHMLFCLFIIQNVSNSARSLTNFMILRYINFWHYFTIGLVKFIDVKTEAGITWCVIAKY